MVVRWLRLPRPHRLTGGALESVSTVFGHLLSKIGIGHERPPAACPALLTYFLVAGCGAFTGIAQVQAQNVAATVSFDIPAGRLADALDRFGEQSGLQIVYSPVAVEGRSSPPIAGPMKAPEALARLILASGLSWRLVNDRTIAVYDAHKSGAAAAQTTPSAEAGGAAQPRRASAVELARIEVTARAQRSPASMSSNFALGYSKPLLDTPRTVSEVSSEQMESQGLATIEDMLRVVPGTFTTTRYDLQGGINVRSFASDVFFRGMKRLTLQGHARTDLNAIDSLEVVEGPPSPIYGMGSMGGYTNMMPKSARSQSGVYLPELGGFTQASVGSYSKSVAEAGIGSPYRIAGRDGGYYVFGLLEDSQNFIEQVGVHQKILQASTTLNNFIGPFRLESGTQYSNSKTSGSYMNRVTQDLIASGRYIKGSPLAPLDADGDGRIGYLDMQRSSPVAGSLGAGNQPLLQYFTWPTDPATGKPYRLGRFPVVSGIPQTMMDYLKAHPEADPSGLLRAQGVGGPLPSSGQLPVGFVLDPRTVGFTRVDWHRNGAFERQQDTDQWLYYFDMVDDSDPDFIVKNQLFLDNLTQTKDSYLPYGEYLDTHAVEDKITVSRRIPASALPSWLALSSVTSLNYRLTRARLIDSGDDFDYRQDVMGPDSGRLTSNTSFWNWLDNPSVETGAPATVSRASSYDEFGIGMLLDIDLLRSTNLIAGGRWDGSDARSADYQRFNAATGTSASPGGISPEHRVNGWSSGTSWSVSLTQRLPYGIRPYVTVAHSSDVLDDVNNILIPSIATAPGGFIGNSRLKEAGIKAGLLGNRLYLSFSAYDQTRTDLQGPSNPAGTAYRTQTAAQGLEAQFHWNATHALELYGYALFQHSRYVQNSQEQIELNGRLLGFKDVVDPASGRVIYPAEAFLYGGRTLMSIPAGVLDQYEKRTGDPEQQFGLNCSYQIGRGLSARLGGVWLSSAYLDRMQTTVLPHSLVLNSGLGWDQAPWHFKLNGYNLNNELYFRARSTDASNNMATVMPGRTYEFTARIDF